MDDEDINEQKTTKTVVYNKPCAVVAWHVMAYMRGRGTHRHSNDDLSTLLIFTSLLEKIIPKTDTFIHSFINFVPDKPSVLPLVAVSIVQHIVANMTCATVVAVCSYCGHRLFSVAIIIFCFYQ